MNEDNLWNIVGYKNSEWDDPVFKANTLHEAAELIIDELRELFNDERYSAILIDAATAVRSIRDWQNYAKNPGNAVDIHITKLRNKYHDEVFDSVVSMTATMLTKMQDITYQKNKL